MVRLGEIKKTYADDKPFAPSVEGGLFQAMVDAVDALRTELAQKYPYRHQVPYRDVDYGNYPGFLPKDSPVSEMQFEPDADLLDETAASSVPSIEWRRDFEGKGFAGRADYNRNVIEMLPWHDIEEALGTFRHEYAHMATAFISRDLLANHDDSWMIWADKTGAARSTQTARTPKYYAASDPHIKRGGVTDQLYIEPLAKLELDMPIDRVYENRKLLADRMTHADEVIRRLITVHPRPSVAIAIATNTSLEPEMKVKLLTADVLYERVSYDAPAYRKFASDPRYSAGWGLQFKRDAADALSAQELLESYGEGMLQDRLDALAHIYKSAPAIHRKGSIYAELKETQAVLDAHKGISSQLEVDESPKESERGWLDELFARKTERRKGTPTEKETKRLDKDLIAIKEVSSNQALGELKRAEIAAKSAPIYAKKLLRPLGYRDYKAAESLLEEASEYVWDLIGYRDDFIKRFENREITEEEYEEKLPLLDNLAAGAQDALWDAFTEIKEHRPDFYLRSFSGRLRDIFIEERRNRDDEDDEMDDDWLEPVVDDDVPIEEVSPEVEGGWLEPVTDMVADDAPSPAQADIPPPIAPAPPPIGDKHPSSEQVAALRQLAEQMPELAGIARDAESYKPAETQAVINDLAKELQRRQAKKRKPVRNRQRAAVGPKGNS